MRKVMIMILFWACHSVRMNPLPHYRNPHDDEKEYGYVEHLRSLNYDVLTDLIRPRRKILTDHVAIRKDLDSHPS